MLVELIELILMLIWLGLS